MAKQTRAKQRGKKQWLVFISHHGMDTWVAKRIEEKIRLCGADTFLDQTRLASGDNLEARIWDALERANEVVALLTPWAMTRTYVWTEMGMAVRRGVRIVGVLYGIKPEEPALPGYMRQSLLVNINDLDRYLAELKERVPRSGRR